MKTIYELQQIANRLRQVTEVNSISPEDTFGLQSDILEYMADMEQNAEGLGIHKVYASYAAMVADASAPVGSNGKALRFGQLVVIYNSSNTTQAESGNVYAWQKGNTGAAAWLLMGNLGSVYALQSQIDSLLSALADEERARGMADSTLQDRITALETLQKASDDAIHLLQYPLRLKVTGAPEGFVGVGESFAYTLSADRKDGTDETSEVAFGISVDGGTPMMLTKGLKRGIIKTEVGVHKIMFNALKGYENPEVEVSYTALPAFYAGLFAEADLVAVSTNLVTDTNKIQPNGYSANFAPDSTGAAYLWVAMPSSLKLDAVEMGDVSVPMEAGVSSGTMVYYRSSSQLDYKESFGEILFNFDF